VAYIKHSLGRTYYTRKGRNRKTPVIWLHGGPGGMHQPNGNVFQLADDRVADLGRIKVPTMIICGEHDEARPNIL
jgi:pimeloyl-ACP methyl ester carboxylesterase